MRRRIFVQKFSLAGKFKASWRSEDAKYSKIFKENDTSQHDEGRVFAACASCRNIMSAGRRRAESESLRNARFPLVVRARRGKRSRWAYILTLRTTRSSPREASLTSRYGKIPWIYQRTAIWPTARRGERLSSRGTRGKLRVKVDARARDPISIILARHRSEYLP